MKQYLEFTDSANSQTVDINFASVATKLRSEYVTLKLKEASVRYTATTTVALGSIVFQIATSSLKAINVLYQDDGIILKTGSVDNLAVSASAKLAVSFEDNDNVKAIVPKSHLLGGAITITIGTRASNTTVDTVTTKTFIFELEEYEME
jgi:hypothetical protein